ncbi:MAG: 1-(5-phosphoribosyl)-5-[(5-phosphoribosylamino)methylideneamino]imidazole-4-carboxamide isomerase [Alphaproteobacteria bacterium CG11_big_fil_rev_8_21_14_0_20_44_7]|nr:MAG: 1-(5-phosphoribosyl)-5-[(5-phosphoribosylamino)methylideneamino]imidazole-4-carboxamide isomerase [Alphaproteobacteria bacterium CG11_big_fil_rev_8_21_14_0_20_44_7]
MIIYPAIDLKDGNCVRLIQGRMDEETVFSTSPVEQAKKWQDSGFKWIHVVDLNGAIEGKPKNIYSVSKIIRAVNVPVQLGGGVRDIKTAEAWIEAGVSRVILGTLALEKPSVVKELCKLYPNKIAIGIDAKGGKVATHGWLKTSETKAVDLAKSFEDSGVAAIIYTDIARDGVMEGVNLEETITLADSVNIPVIASGGVACLDDVKELKESGKLEGVVIGRALYDNIFTAEELNNL